MMLATWRQDYYISCINAAPALLQNDPKQSKLVRSKAQDNGTACHESEVKDVKGCVDPGVTNHARWSCGTTKVS